MTCACNHGSHHKPDCPLAPRVRLPHYARAILTIHGVPFYEERFTRSDFGLRVPLWAFSAPQYLWAVVCWDGMRSVDRMRWLRVRCATDYTTAVDAYLAMEALAMLIAPHHNLGRVIDWSDGEAYTDACRSARRRTGTGARSEFRTNIITAKHTPYTQLRGLLEAAERACGFGTPTDTKQWAEQMMQAWHSYGRSGPVLLVPRSEIL